MAQPSGFYVLENTGILHAGQMTVHAKNAVRDFPVKVNVLKNKNKGLSPGWHASCNSHYSSLNLEELKND
jgi:hypothetical protein